jgi:membrane-associated protease RseP (regulator of RpoE activity)
LPRLRLPRHPLFHLALLLATLVTTTFFGGVGFFLEAPLSQAVRDPAVWRSGLSFSVPLLLILGIHELGHVAACRRYGLPATLPYFLPAPIGIGTFGAIIRIRAPISEKRVLFDVGAAGPIAGFLATIPVLLWGVAGSRMAPAAPTGPYFEFSEPLLFRWVEHALFPATRHGADLLLSPPGFAAWFGLLVTALNLLPLAQLDGGHILYAVAGRRQRPIGFVLFGTLVALGFLWPGWFVWAVIVLLMGIAHPQTADESRPLGPRRLWLAAACLVIFALCFTAVPIRIATPSPTRSPRPAPTYHL